jgi:streptomycin 6-kinase
MKVVLPAELAKNIPELFGDRGQEWVARLPTLVESLCRDWALTLEGPAMTGGTHSYVAPVRPTGRLGADVAHLVLKVPVLDDENYAEAAALRCYDGDGAVRLHRVDLATGALLLERAQPGDALLHRYERGEIPLHTVLDIATSLLHRLRRVPSGDVSCPAPGQPAPGATPTARPGTTDQPFPLVRDLAERWAGELVGEHDELGRPFDHGLFTEAAALSAELAVPDGPAVIVNRDGHTGNMLSSIHCRPASAVTPWLLIDPKPLLGDAAFDAGHLIWDLLRYEPTTRRARYVIDGVADGLGVARVRARAWALVRTVDNLCWAQAAGRAAPYLAVASAIEAAR